MRTPRKSFRLTFSEQWEVEMALKDRIARREFDLARAIEAGPMGADPKGHETHLNFIRENIKGSKSALAKLRLD